MPKNISKSWELKKLVSGERDVRKRTVGTYDVSGEPDVRKRTVGTYDVSGEPDVHNRTVGTYDVSGEDDVQKRRWLVLMTSMVGTGDIRDEFDIRKTMDCIDGVNGKFTFARQ